jgi:hypothetical protein
MGCVATAIATILVLSVVTLPAAADDRATAQQLFQQGKALFKEGRFTEACPQFAAAAELSPTPGVRLNLGDCYDKIGRTASAWVSYDEALSVARKTDDSLAADLARARMAALKPRLSFFSVTVPPGPIVPGLTVSRDGEVVPQTAWGASVPVDPGDHAIAATAPGQIPWRSTTSVSGPGEHPVTVPRLQPTQTASPSTEAAAIPSGTMPIAASTEGAPKTPPTGEGPFSGNGGTERTLAVVAGGLAIVGVAIGSYYGARMLSKKSEYQSHESGGQCEDIDCQTASHDAASAGNVATVAFVAGGTLLGAGAALWLFAPTSGGPSTGSAGFRVLAGVVQGGPELGLAGSF